MHKSAARKRKFMHKNVANKLKFVHKNVTRHILHKTIKKTP